MSFVHDGTVINETFSVWIDFHPFFDEFILMEKFIEIEQIEFCDCGRHSFFGKVWKFVDNECQ